MDGIFRAHIIYCSKAGYKFLFQDENSDVILEERGDSEKGLDKLLEAAVQIGVYNIEIICEKAHSNNISVEAMEMLETFGSWKFIVNNIMISTPLN